MAEGNIHKFNGGNHNGGQKKFEVDISDFDPVECDCGSKVFHEGHQLAKLSKVHPKNPTGETQFVKIPVNICMGCGKASTNQDHA